MSTLVIGIGYILKRIILNHYILLLNIFIKMRDAPVELFFHPHYLFIYYI